MTNSNSKCDLLRPCQCGSTYKCLSRTVLEIHSDVFVFLLEGRTVLEIHSDVFVFLLEDLSAKEQDLLLQGVTVYSSKYKHRASRTLSACIE